MSQDLETITIYFYGVGCTVAKGSVDDLLWNYLIQCSKLLNVSVERAIFDLEFFTKLNLPKFDSWRCFNNLYDFSGLSDDIRSIIEIKQSGKKKSKIRFKELLGDELLFSLYKVKILVADDFHEGRNITIVENEIGMISRYKFKCLHFDIEKLGFTISKVSVNSDINYTMINDVTYDGKILKSSKSDTLVTSNFAIVDND